MKFNFEPFTAVGGSYAEKVSIRSNGTIGLSQGVMRRRKLCGQQWYALFFYDAEHAAIGLRFTTDGNEKGAMRIGARKVVGKDGTENWGGYIAARAFLDFNGIDYHKMKDQAYRPEWNDEFGGLVVVLDPERAEKNDGESWRR